MGKRSVEARNGLSSLNSLTLVALSISASTSSCETFVSLDALFPDKGLGMRGKWIPPAVTGGPYDENEEEQRRVA
jgi:hypothetical protein